MTKQQLLENLQNIVRGQTDPLFHTDQEGDHLEADDLLLTFINDPEIRVAFDEIDKWYA